MSLSSVKVSVICCVWHHSNAGTKRSTWDENQDFYVWSYGFLWRAGPCSWSRSLSMLGSSSKKDRVRLTNGSIQQRYSRCTSLWWWSRSSSCRWSSLFTGLHPLSTVKFLSCTSVLPTLCQQFEEGPSRSVNTRRSHTFSHLAWEHLGIPQEELESVSREREVRAEPSQHVATTTPTQDKQKEDERKNCQSVDPM